MAKTNMSVKPARTTVHSDITENSPQQHTSDRFRLITDNGSSDRISSVFIRQSLLN